MVTCYDLKIFLHDNSVCVSGFTLKTFNPCIFVMVLNKKLSYFCISVTYFIFSQQGIIILNTMKLIPVGLLLLLLFKT